MRLVRHRAKHRARGTHGRFGLLRVFAPHRDEQRREEHLEVRG